MYYLVWRCYLHAFQSYWWATSGAARTSDHFVRARIWYIYIYIYNNTTTNDNSNHSNNDNNNNNDNNTNNNNGPTPPIITTCLSSLLGWRDCWRAKHSRGQFRRTRRSVNRLFRSSGLGAPRRIVRPKIPGPVPAAVAAELGGPNPKHLVKNQFVFVVVYKSFT